MNDHDRMRELVALAAAGAADAGEQLEAERHAESCAECRAELAALAAIGRELAALPPPAVPEGLTARAHARALSAVSGESVPVKGLCALGVYGWLLSLAVWLLLAAIDRDHAAHWFTLWMLLGWVAALAAAAALALARRAAGRTL